MAESQAQEDEGQGDVVPTTEGQGDVGPPTDGQGDVVPPTKGQGDVVPLLEARNVGQTCYCSTVCGHQKHVIFLFT